LNGVRPQGFSRVWSTVLFRSAGKGTVSRPVVPQRQYHLSAVSLPYRPSRMLAQNSSPKNRKTPSIHIFSNHVRVLATRCRENDASSEDIPLPPAEQQGRYLFVAMAARSARTKFRVQLGDAALLITLAPLTDHRSTNPAAPGELSVGPHHRQTAARSARAAPTNAAGCANARSIAAATSPTDYRATADQFPG
jgi:hypothetical protein